jgi:hypothetical protein
VCAATLIDTEFTTTFMLYAPLVFSSRTAIIMYHISLCVRVSFFVSGPVSFHFPLCIYFVKFARSPVLIKILTHRAAFVFCWQNGMRWSGREYTRDTHKNSKCRMNNSRSIHNRKRNVNTHARRSRNAAKAYFSAYPKYLQGALSIR